MRRRSVSATLPIDIRLLCSKALWPDPKPADFFSRLNLFFQFGAVLIIAPLWRFGLLATVSFALFAAVSAFPITTEFTAWYATGFVLYLVVMVALVVYGFYTSLAGQPLFGGKLFEE